MNANEIRRNPESLPAARPVHHRTLHALRVLYRRHTLACWLALVLVAAVVLVNRTHSRRAPRQVDLAQPAAAVHQSRP
jgi:hypothetical protein